MRSKLEFRKLRAKLCDYLGKARQCESDGLFKDAQELYEQIVQAYPDFIYGWANLGNVLTQQGDLKEGLMCYREGAIPASLW